MEKLVLGHQQEISADVGTCKKKINNKKKKKTKQ